MVRATFGQMDMPIDIANNLLVSLLAAQHLENVGFDRWTYFCYHRSGEGTWRPVPTHRVADDEDTYPAPTATELLAALPPAIAIEGPGFVVYPRQDVSACREQATPCAQFTLTMSDEGLFNAAYRLDGLVVTWLRQGEDAVPLMATGSHLPDCLAELLVPLCAQGLIYLGVRPLDCNEPLNSSINK